MNIRLNGESRDVPQDITVSGLLEWLGHAGKRVAVEKNGEIVPKSQHGATPVQANDQLEIVVAVGGG